MVSVATIRATGATALAEAFKVNTTISGVSWNNNIGDTGAVALEKSLVNTTISEVYLEQQYR